MKRWQKVTSSIAVAAVVLCAAGTMTYKLYIKPKYVDKVITAAQTAVKSDALNSSVSELVQKLDEEGTLDDKTRDMYNKSYSDEDKERLDNIIDNEEIDAESIQREAAQAAEEAPSADESSEEASSDSESSEGGSSSTEASDEDASSEDSSSSGESSSGSGSSSSTGSTAQERIKAAATAEEYATGARILAKIDVGKATSLYKSDKSAFMDYLHSTLSSSEINQALQLYFKYKDLL